MPKSMYDKLGDLLSHALDSGFILGKEKNKEEELKDSFEEKKETDISRPLPEKVKKALNKINFPENIAYTEAKKIYREKLMYYHPDRRNTNPVLQKVAREKTQELIENWKIIEEYYKQGE